MFSNKWYLDTFERVAATFAESAIGLWIMTGPAGIFNLGVAKGAAAAGVISGLAVLKAALAAKVGNPDSASLNASAPAA